MGHFFIVCSYLVQLQVSETCFTLYTGLLRVRASGDQSSYASKHQRVGKKRKILPHSRLRQCAFCPLALFTPAGVAVAGSRQYQSLVLLLLLLSAPQILLDLLQARHGPVDGGRVNQVKVVHVDQMQEEVSTQVAADDVSAAVLGEQHDGLVHLVVCYETKEKTAWFYSSVQTSTLRGRTGELWPVERTRSS